jgi:hypothetical protein
MEIEATCFEPTKTLTKNKVYKGIPVRKNKPDGSFNGSWTTKWKSCTQKQSTSYKVIDDVGIVRYISKKRFHTI